VWSLALVAGSICSRRPEVSHLSLWGRARQALPLLARTIPHLSFVSVFPRISMISISGLMAGNDYDSGSQAKRSRPRKDIKASVVGTWDTHRQSTVYSRSSIGLVVTRYESASTRTLSLWHVRQGVWRRHNRVFSVRRLESSPMCSTDRRIIPTLQ